MNNATNELKKLPITVTRKELYDIYPNTSVLTVKRAVWAAIDEANETTKLKVSKGAWVLTPRITKLVFSYLGQPAGYEEISY